MAKTACAANKSITISTISQTIVMNPHLSLNPIESRTKAETLQWILLAGRRPTPRTAPLYLVAQCQ
jgi:hypothetical protein